VPLWFLIPLVGGLWLSSWISLLDTTGNAGDMWLLWGATLIASVLLAMRLMRASA